MPSRILREGIISSPRIDRLSMGAELFYRRLMSVADDHGRYYAEPATLVGACWPTTPEKVCAVDVKQWLSECCASDVQLISIYENKGRKYLQMTDFRQQTRAKSKFPDPDNHLLSTREASAQPIRSSESVSVVRSSPVAVRDAEPPPTPATIQPMPEFDPTDGDVQVGTLVDDLMKVHPTKGNRSIAEATIGRLLSEAVHRVATEAAIRDSHRLWLPEWRRRQEAGSFVPQLHRWISDGDYLNPPEEGAPVRTRAPARRDVVQEAADLIRAREARGK